MLFIFLIVTDSRSLYQMVTQSMLRTHEGKYVFSERKKIRHVTSFDLINCLKQLKQQKLHLTSAPYDPELNEKPKKQGPLILLDWPLNNLFLLYYLCNRVYLNNLSIPPRLEAASEETILDKGRGSGAEMYTWMYTPCLMYSVQFTLIDMVCSVVDSSV